MSYYRFIPDQKVEVNSYVGLTLSAAVISRYTSDEHNHTAKPHKRYVIAYTPPIYGKLFDDVSEGELEEAAEVQDLHE